ncbi:Aste57867_9996 [Aphanomyces stellatus]|uniref:Aste57867_9996 protein n=1 Tax=Aphanomyces stellatus TaxID=120398 RepID=A0A485KP94_9STRA|nr:hypothetical protein As57867_009957 [Aphanomyces stellatus]VFT86874.1 Aste57867_9996 [Aphanomyces stellatus]
MTSKEPTCCHPPPFDASIESFPMPVLPEATILRTLIRNVSVFDGHSLLPGTHNVLLDGGRIAAIHSILPPSDDDTGLVIVDGSGRFLVPGFIDTHIHISTTPAAMLHDLRHHGVTTALDMATWPAAKFRAVQGIDGFPTIHSAGTFATSPESMHGTFPGLPAIGQITSADQAPAFVATQLADGARFIKLIASEDDGLSQPILNAVVRAADAAGCVSICHAATSEPFTAAVASHVRVVTHIPADAPLSSALVEQMQANGQANSPTLSMMEKTCARWPRYNTMETALANVRRLHEAGIPIALGTDSNDTPAAPGLVPFGQSVHGEMKLLRQAGLSELDVLRSATSVAASVFGLSDRGVIQEGKRADVVLLAENPVADIHATRSVEIVWLGGVQHCVAARE